MVMQMTNILVAKMLREVATALTIHKTSFFQIRAYENAAANIENSSSEIKDLWDQIGTLTFSITGKFLEVRNDLNNKQDKNENKRNS